MNFVPHFNLFGVEAKQIPCIEGKGAPTTATEGAVGCFYMNTEDGKVYKCTAVNNDVYTWADIGVQGEDGKSAYEIALEKGFEGTEEEWLASLQAENGEDGKTPTFKVENDVLSVSYDNGTSWNTLGNIGGSDGVGISKIEKTATNGNIDTYTITLTNGVKFTFTVTNGTDATVTAESISNALGYTPVKSAGWGANKNLGTDENGNVIEKEDIFSKDVSAWTPVEYMGGVAWTELGYYWQSNGTLTSTQYTTEYRATAELIKIEPNCKYTLSGLFGTYYLYDANGKNGVSSETHTAPANAITFQTNANQHFIGISHKPTGSFTAEKVSLIRTTISEAEYNSLPTQADTLKTLYGKKIVCLGDSLFGMYRGETSAPAYIAKHTGATVYNCGFGGCRMSVHPTSGYAAFSMWALAKAIAENNWTTQDAQAASGSSYFPEHLALLKSLDFNKIDYVVIHYGTNDFGAGGNGVEIDNPNSVEDYTTLCGALRYSINKLLTAYPKLRIYISLPVYRYWTTDGVNTYAENYPKNGYKLSDFVDALRGVAVEFNLPVIDGYYGLGINKYNASTYLGDGTHHNESGRKMFGEYIGANLIAQQTSAKSGIDEDAINALIDEVSTMINDAIGSAIGGAY